jgi:hypothetical protein
VSAPALVVHSPRSSVAQAILSFDMDPIAPLTPSAKPQIGAAVSPGQSRDA